MIVILVIIAIVVIIVKVILVVIVATNLSFLAWSFIHRPGPEKVVLATKGFGFTSFRLSCLVFVFTDATESQNPILINPKPLMNPKP